MPRDLSDDNATTVTSTFPNAAAQTHVPQMPLGRYVLMEKLGEGGMGAVFAAHDPMLNRKIAIKVLRRQLSNPDYGARMVREAQSLAKLSHPNVVGLPRFKRPRRAGGER